MKLGEIIKEYRTEHGMNMDFNELFAMIDSDIIVNTENIVNTVPIESGYIIPVLGRVCAGNGSEAIEEGYFKDEGIELTLITGFGADKTMTAVLTDEAQIGFMGSESTIYTYAGGSKDYVVNFAQLTQRAGNFLVSREPIDNFSWDMLKGTTVLGGRAGGMPEMVFEFILEKNNIDPKIDLSIDQSIDFGSTAAAFSGGQGDFTVVNRNLLHQI